MGVELKKKNKHQEHHNLVIVAPVTVMLFLTCITGKADAWTKRNRETDFIVSKN
jgi:hypothetical protein